MNSPSVQAALKRDPPYHSVGNAGYIVTNEMYGTLYNLYYQRCARNRVPCLVIVRHGSHCRLDLDMTCSHLDLTEWARDAFIRIFTGIGAQEVYSDEVYLWATHIPNRLADRLAREVLAALDDGRATRRA